MKHTRTPALRLTVKLGSRASASGAVKLCAWNGKLEQMKVAVPMERNNSSHTKVAILLGVAALVVVLFLVFRDRLNLEYLADRETDLRSLSQSRPWLIRALAFVAYVVATGLSFPGAALLSMIYGWFFGFWQALPMISFASTAGAVVAFLASRYLLRDWIESRFQDRYQKIDAAFAQEGAYYLFTLRLIPLVPFFVINAVMGLTRIPVHTFWWVSQLGMLPGTIAFVYAGSAVPSIHTLVEKGAKGVLDWRLFLAFAMLGLLPLVLKKLVNRFRPSKSEHQPRG